ncbi:Aryl hydrocarbon receptor nuclear translocator-like protein 1, partial [Armadillidium nasatum]
ANGNSSNSDFSREDETSSSSDETSSNTDADSEILVAFVKVVRDRLVTELTWVESMRDEYITRHKLDGSMVHVDHRISFVTGFMPEEVLGNSAFYYMHPDDLCWSILAQKQMLLNGAGQGLVTYRLRCTDGSFVILRSRGFLEVDKDSGKVDTFICINTLLTVNTAADEIKTQRKKLLPMLKDAPLDSVEESFESGLPSELKSIIMKHGNLKKFIKVIGSVMSDPSEDIDLSRLMFDSTLEVSQNGHEEIIGTPKDHEMQLGKEIITKKRSFNQGDISSKLQRRSADTAVSVIPSDELSFPPSHKKRIPSPCTEFSHSTPQHINGEISPSTDSETYWSDSENITSFNKSLAIQNTRALSISRPSNWNKSVENSATPNEYRNNYFLSVQPSYSEIQNWGYPNYSTDFSNHSSSKPSESLNNSENIFLPHNCISSGFGTAMENGCQKRDVSSGNHCNGISDP